MKLLLLMIAFSIVVFGQTQASRFIPLKGTTAPATCTVGELFYDTDAPAGSNLYACTAANTWTLQAGGSGTELTAAATSGADNTILRSVGDSRAMEGTGCTISDTHQISCTGGVAAAGTTAGAVTLNEASANGSNFVAWKAPDSVTADQTLLLPGAANAANQALRFGSPSSNISTGSWALPLWMNGTNANGYFDWTLGSAPGNPTAGDIRLYPKTGSTLCARDSAGTETCYGSGSGGGGGVQRVAYSSLPICDGALTNVLVKLTDGFLNAHCNGTSYQWYYGDMPVTLPGAVSGWTQVNTPSTAADSKGGIFLRAAATNGTNLRTILKSASGDFTFTGAFLNGSAGQSNNMCGIVIAAGDTTSSRLYLWGVLQQDGSSGNVFQLIAEYATNYTTAPTLTVLSSTGYPHSASQPRFYRIAQSGTNWTYSTSIDGQNFVESKASAARPFTPTHVGFGCDSRGDGTFDSDAAMTIIHYTNN